MKRYVLLLALGFIFLPGGTLLAVTAEEAQREVLVYVRTDTTIIIPPPSISATLSQVTINYQPLRDMLEHHPVEVIEKSDPNFDRADTIAYDSAGRPIQLLDLYRLFRVRLVSGGDLCALKQALDSLGGDVVFSEINGIAQFHAIEPQDNLFPQQWGLKNTGQANGTFDEDIQATEAWEITQGSPYVKIGIIDAGIDVNHPDLFGRTENSETYTVGDSSYWHGTHVAGIAAASANNNYSGSPPRYRGVVGVDWNARIIAKNISTFDLVTIYNKVIAAVDAGANVLNNSWGGGFFPDCPYPDYPPSCVQYAFAYAYRQNRVSVASMGNSGAPDVFYPAAFNPGVIAVGALLNNGNVHPLSTWGNHIDVSAPGGVWATTGTDQRDILSTVPRNSGTVTDSAEYSYRYAGGTSMAAPFVTGLASLLKGYNWNLSNDDIENIIKLSADDRVQPPPFTIPPGPDIFSGYGRINARRALELLRPPYVLLRDSVFGGADVAQDTGLQINIQGVYDLGMAAGTYVVDRHEILQTVTFPFKFYADSTPLSSDLFPWPAAWGRGVGSVGRLGDNPSFDIPYCEVVPGTLTPTGCQLRTYFYWVRSGPNSEEPVNRWLPADPSQAKMAYSVLGEPLLKAPVLSLSYPALDSICSPDSGCRWRVKGIRLNITETDTNAEEMFVERKDTSGFWLTRDWLWSDTSLVDEYDFMGSRTYYYRIRALTQTQEVYSDSVPIKIPPKPPVGVRASIVWAESCGVENFYPPGGGGGLDAPDGGGPDLPPGCETVPTNMVILSWNAPSNQNPAVPIVSYRVDAFWKKNRTVMNCFGFPVTRLWETFEQSETTPSVYTRDTLCLQHTDTLYNFYATAFDAAGDSSLVWIKQGCPLPDSQLVVARVQAQSGSTCVTQCCNVPAPRIVPTGGNLPKEFALAQNYPNPFNAATVIRFALPQPSRVELRIYNILGQAVRTFTDEKPAGFYEALWDGRDENGAAVSSGIYLYQIRARDFVQTKKMQLIK